MLAAHVRAWEASVVQAARTAEPPRIDGRLDDTVWSQAPVTDRFFQREPVEGARPTERTEVRVLFDDLHLYFAQVESDPARPRVRRLTSSAMGSQPR